MTRDFYKSLTTKHYYNKQNDKMKNYPILHSTALYLGVKSEKVSHLIEDIFKYRILKWELLDPTGNINYSLD